MTTAPTPAPDRESAAMPIQPFTVAQVVGQFGGGGAARMAYNLALALHWRGVPSIAIAVRSAGSYSQDEEDLEIIDLRVGGNPLRLPSAGLKLRQIIREFDVKLLHVHGHSTLPFCVAATRMMRRAPRVCFTWHSADNLIPGALTWRDRPTTWALRRCENVYGTSRVVADELSERFKINPRARVFRNGVQRSMSASHRVDARQPLIIWMARFMPSKNPQSLIRVLARLNAEGLPFRALMAGSAPAGMQPFFRESQTLARQLGVADRIDMPGWVERGEMLPLEGAIGVQCSQADGLSISLLEQMMAGLGVVATDVGDTSEAVVDNVTGLLIPPNDEEALYVAIKRLVTDVALRRRLGEAARRMAWEHFSLESMADRAALDYGLPPVPAIPFPDANSAVAEPG